MYFLLVTIVVFILAGQSDGIECYTCAICGDSIKTLPTTTGCTYCGKVVLNAVGITVVSRQCLPLCTPGSQDVENGGGQVTCCQTSLCNGAPVKKFAGGLFASIALVYMAKLLFA